MRIGGKTDRNLFHNFETIALEANDFLGIVGKKADFPDAEIVKHLSSHAIVS
jgi:hypothetical protein